MGGFPIQEGPGYSTEKKIKQIKYKKWQNQMGQTIWKDMNIKKLHSEKKTNEQIPV